MTKPSEQNENAAEPGGKAGPAQLRLAESQTPAEAPGLFASIRERWSERADRGKKRYISEMVTEFQSDAVEIERGPPPQVARLTTYTLLGLFATAVTWASWAEVDKIVTARGQLVPTTPQIVVQPFETSVIKAIKVRAGDVVRKGDVLVVLDATFVGSDYAQLQSQHASFGAHKDRLEAELAQRDYVIPDSPTKDQILQEAVWRQRRATYTSRLEDIAQQIAESEASLDTLKRDQVVLQDRLKVIEQIESMRRDLERSSVGSKLNVLIARSDSLSVRRELERTRSTIVQEQHHLAALRAQQETFESEWRQKVTEELIEVGRRLESVVEQLQKAERRRELVNLVAPEDAVVLQVAQRSVGSVQQAAEALVTMVPLHAELEAEVRIMPEDVGPLRTGLPAKIKLNAFPFQKHGTLEGELRSISENTFTPSSQAEGGSYYRAQIKLTVTDLRNLPEGHRLLPGMTLSSEIKLGTRSVISYFLYPLIRTFDESLREP
ncbi:MAG: HlyD family type I secretion periplasmic adaptor subunit [Caulobacter sp.]|nr:HlyD family type I secretion periplasmic adaptor subunit [Caulobacter sp.]